jgi:hypothetical protein
VSERQDLREAAEQGYLGRFAVGSGPHLDAVNHCPDGLYGPRFSRLFLEQHLKFFDLLAEQLGHTRVRFDLELLLDTAELRFKGLPPLLQLGKLFANQAGIAVAAGNEGEAVLPPYNSTVFDIIP